MTLGELIALVREPITDAILALDGTDGIWRDRPLDERAALAENELRTLFDRLDEIERGRDEAAANEGWEAVQQVARLREALSEIVAEGYDGDFAVETARNALGLEAHDA